MIRRHQKRRNPFQGKPCGCDKMIPESIFFSAAMFSMWLSWIKSCLKRSKFDTISILGFN
uniref:Uncharacterized protein n=1 Tax=Oryza brachyantha TaxID=4533 RepID=J3LVN6_ORYBR